LSSIALALSFVYNERSTFFEDTNMIRHILVWLVAALFLTAARAEDPHEAAARQAWTITDVVLDQDIEPPARQEMLLHGLKALLRKTPERIPSDLARRVSTVTTRQQFADLLAELWPKDDEKNKGEDGERILFQGLLGWRSESEREASYLSPRDVKTREMLAGNRYVGTGIQVRQNAEEKLTQILIPFPGGPARKAGARPRDLIVEVDDRSMKGRSLSEVVRCLQGEEGTKVSMTVRQPGEDKTRRLDMVRSVIPFASIHGYRRTGEDSWSFRVDPKTTIGYLFFEDIKSSTLLELRKIEPMLRADGVRAVVLDLRSTSGRDLRHAALLADGLIDGGVLWRVRDSRGRIKDYKADRDCLFRDVPLAVLVDEYTGSMGALTAAALQDRGRAVVVGDMPKTELTVTSLVPLPEERGALLLRTGRLERTPRANRTEQQRLALAAHRLWPDQRIVPERKEMEAIQIWKQQQQSPEVKADAKAPNDPQLHAALERLRQALAEQDKKEKP
jgi:C-terminal peptidase prc